MRTAKRKKSLPQLKKILWRFFSEYIRRRDADENGLVKCISCEEVRHWKLMHCGHYEKRTFLGTCFEEKNNAPQCPRCNFFLDGNQSAYAIALRKLYGPDILEELDKQKNSKEKISRQEYDDLISTYTLKLKGLDGFVFGARG